MKNFLIGLFVGRILFFLLIVSARSEEILKREDGGKNGETQESSSCENIDVPPAFLDSREILWRIHPSTGTVLAFSPQTNKPLWTEDGVVFSLAPLTPQDRQSVFLEVREKSPWEKPEIGSILQNHSSANEMITEIEGRIYILLNSSDTLQNSDKTVPYVFSDSSKAYKGLKCRWKTLIALASDQEGRLLWQIDVSWLPFSDAEFTALPKADPQGKDVLLLEIGYLAASENSHSSKPERKTLHFRIDAATGEILSEGQ